MPTHIMLCDYGDLGLAYRETDPAEADETSIVETMLHGECDWPVSVVAFDTHACWARDVSADIAVRIAEEAERRGIDLLANTRTFVERHAGSPSIIPVGPWIEPAEVLRGAMAMIRAAVAAAGGQVPDEDLPTSEQAEILAKTIRELAVDRDQARQFRASRSERISESGQRT
jgi:hypothetical protein